MKRMKTNQGSHQNLSENVRKFVTLNDLKKDMLDLEQLQTIGPEIRDGPVRSYLTKRAKNLELHNSDRNDSITTFSQTISEIEDNMCDIMSSASERVIHHVSRPGGFITSGKSNGTTNHDKHRIKRNTGTKYSTTSKGYFGNNNGTKEGVSNHFGSVRSIRSTRSIGQKSTNRKTSRGSSIKSKSSLLKSRKNGRRIVLQVNKGNTIGAKTPEKHSLIKTARKQLSVSEVSTEEEATVEELQELQKTINDVRRHLSRQNQLYDDVNYKCKMVNKEVELLAEALNELSAEERELNSLESTFKQEKSQNTQLLMSANEDFHKVLKYSETLYMIEKRLIKESTTFKQTLDAYTEVVESERLQVEDLSKERKDSKFLCIQTTTRYNQMVSRIKEVKNEWKRQISVLRQTKQNREKARDDLKNIALRDEAQQNLENLAGSILTDIANNNYKKNKNKLVRVVRHNHSHEEGLRKIQLVTGLSEEGDIINEYLNRDKLMEHIDSRNRGFERHLNILKVKRNDIKEKLECDRFEHNKDQRDVSRSIIDSLAKDKVGAKAVASRYLSRLRASKIAQSQSCIILANLCEELAQYGVPRQFMEVWRTRESVVHLVNKVPFGTLGTTITDAAKACAVITLKSSEFSRGSPSPSDVTRKRAKLCTTPVSLKQNLPRRSSFRRSLSLNLDSNSSSSSFSPLTPGSPSRKQRLDAPLKAESLKALRRLIHDGRKIAGINTVIPVTSSSSIEAEAISAVLRLVNPRVAAQISETESQKQISNANRLSRPSRRKTMRRSKRDGDKKATEEEEKNTEEHKAATKLQALQRGRQDRNFAKELKLQKEKEIKKQQELERQMKINVATRQFAFISSRAAQLKQIVIDGPQHYLRVMDPSLFTVSGIRPDLFSPKRKRKRSKSPKRVFFIGEGSLKSQENPKYLENVENVESEQTRSIDDELEGDHPMYGMSDALVEASSKNVRVRSRMGLEFKHSRDVIHNIPLKHNATADFSSSDESSYSENTESTQKYEANDNDKEGKTDLNNPMQGNVDETIHNKKMSSRLHRRAMSKGITLEEAEISFLSIPREHEIQCLSRTQLKRGSNILVIDRSPSPTSRKHISDTETNDARSLEENSEEK